MCNIRQFIYTELFLVAAGWEKSMFFSEKVLSEKIYFQFKQHFDPLKDNHYPSLCTGCLSKLFFSFSWYVFSKTTCTFKNYFLLKYSFEVIIWDISVFFWPKTFLAWMWIVYNFLKKILCSPDPKIIFFLTPCM